jgi:hypothetical protein
VYTASGASNALLVALIVVALFVIVVVRSVQTRTGIGLALLLGVVAIVYAVSVAWNGALIADPTDYLHTHPFGGLGPAISLLVDLFLFALSGCALLVVVASARRWVWLSIVGASFLPLVVLILVGQLPRDPFSYADEIVPFTAVLCCPLIVGLAFALSRRPRRELETPAT